MLTKSLNRLISAPTPTQFRVNHLLRRLISATVENDKFVVVQPDGSSAPTTNTTTTSQPLKFPSVWLRDNCYCTQCFHPTSKSRKHDWDKFDVNVRVEKLQVSQSASLTARRLPVVASSLILMSRNIIVLIFPRQMSKPNN